MTKDLIIDAGYLYGSGTIKTDQQDVSKLAHSGNTNIDLNFKWGFWDDKEHRMKYGEKDFKDINEFKEIVIVIRPGDVIEAEFVGYDGSVSTSCPVNSLDIRLADFNRIKKML